MADAFRARLSATVAVTATSSMPRANIAAMADVARSVHHDADGVGGAGEQGGEQGNVDLHAGSIAEPGGVPV
ncbi:MAG: hypothetical protein U0531_15520 [Dehalococcoidia bacterium]